MICFEIFYAVEDIDRGLTSNGIPGPTINFKASMNLSLHLLSERLENQILSFDSFSFLNNGSRHQGYDLLSKQYRRVVQKEQSPSNKGDTSID